MDKLLVCGSRQAGRLPARAAAVVATLFMAAIFMLSCDDNTEDVGQTLTDDMDEVNITTDTFVVTTRSILADSVLSRNTIGYLGRVKDPECGAYITGDFMAQFNVLEDYQMFPEEDSVTSRNEQGEVIADSCELRLFCTNYFGDSLAVMKVTLMEMSKPMEEGVMYYSNFDPEAEGYVREDGIHKNKTYTIYDQRMTEEYRDTASYSTNIHIKLNDEYTDANGETYDNYGTYLMRTYYAHPEYYKNFYTFIHHVCPGFFVKTKEGIGSMAYIETSRINVYMHFISDSDTVNTYIPFSGTEEVLQTTTITNDDEVLGELVDDNTCTYVKAPAGIFTEMTLPVEEIMEGHENDTLNTAKIVLQRINNTIQGEYTLDTPSALLLVPKDSMYSFFENEEIIDNEMSFLATNSSSSYSLSGDDNEDNTYTFNNVSEMVVRMMDIKNSGRASDDWNKAVIIPVTTTSNSSGTIVKIVHDMSLASTKLVGGSDNRYDDILVTVIYSKFSPTD